MVSHRSLGPRVVKTQHYSNLRRSGVATMRNRIVIATVVAISATILAIVLDSFGQSTISQFIGFPGVGVAILIWGPHGPVPETQVLMFMAVVITVNGLIYGLFTLIFLFVRHH